MKELPYDTNKYLLAFGALFVTIVFLYLIASDNNKFKCDDWANGFKNDFYCSIILTKKEDFAGITTLTGIDLATKNIVHCDDGSKWINEHFEMFKLGDTIVKKKGQYTILIKRKTKKITIPFTCGDKTYKD